MKTYKFGSERAWLNNKPKHADMWQAFTQRKFESRERKLFVFEYEDNELISVTDCTNWMKDYRKGPDAHVRALKELIKRTHEK